MSGHYSAARCDWAKLFGLNPNDLTDEQLAKIDTEKLIELAIDDKRVEQLLSNRFLYGNITIEALSHLKELDTKEIEKIPKLVDSYNELLRIKGTQLEASEKSDYYYSNSRGKYVLYDLLDEYNKLYEHRRWAMYKTSVIDPSTIDFNFICEKDASLGDSIIVRLIKDGQGYSRYGNATTRMITILPKQLLDRNIKSISDANEHYYSYLLSNPNTPKEYIIMGLRAIAGKMRIPKIKVKLSKEILTALPSVTRLKVLETLYVHTRSEVTYEDITDAKDLETLLFSTVIKHNDRVQCVLRYFEHSRR